MKIRCIFAVARKLNMQANYFRINKKEYCHITDDKIFIINSKEVTRVPLEHDVSEAWGIESILNYLVFAFLFGYTGISVSHYGADFFKEPINYGGILILLISFVRVKNGFLSSRTPCISRNKIRSVYFKTPWYSFTQLIVYFEGPEGKVLRRIIPVLYKQEALPVLKESGLLK